jgi:hypothetical protein
LPPELPLWGWLHTEITLSYSEMTCTVLCKKVKKTIILKCFMKSKKYEKISSSVAM